MDIASWLSNFNMFQNTNISLVIAAFGALWLFIQNFWFILLIGGLWLVARKNSRRKEDKENTLPKHLPTKVEVFKMLTDLYLK
jgi:uncharacterized BrkB/YihY/UPF0761 family membrane protein